MSTVTNSLNKVFFRQSATPEYTIASQDTGVVYYGTIVDGGLLIDDSGDGTPIAGPFQTLTPYEDGQRVAFVLRGARPLILSIEGGFTATNQWSGLESITESTAEHSAEVEKALGEAKAALDEEMENLDERLETSRADITQAQEDAAAAILEAIATRDAAMMGAVDWYATTPTPTTPPTTGWSTTPPEWGGGAYIWRKTVVTHGDGTKVEGAPALITGNQGPAGTGAALVRIDSTRGTVFKEAGFSTDLQATVFSGAKQITSIYELWEEFGPTAYLEWWWRKHDDSDFGLISSADTRLSQAGFRLTVSPADVDVSTVFQCVLHA